MTERLSDRQLAILNAIDEIANRGLPPTLREIGEAAGLSSSASIKYQVDQLKLMGLLTQIDNVSRGVSLTAQGNQVLHGEDYTGDNVVDLDVSVQIPLVGQIAAGIPITATQNVERYFSMPKSLVGSGNLFGLRVKGESMIDAAICDGDYVVVRQQQTAENGDIVAALLDDEATVKTFKNRDGHVWLLPRNSTMEPIPGDHASIMGKVVAVFRSL